MGLRPDEKDDDAPKVPFKRTRAQLIVTIVAICLNCIVLFCGGILLLAVGAYGMANLLGVDPAPPERSMHLSIVLGCLFIVMFALAVLGHYKKPKKPIIFLYQLMLLLLIATVAACFGMVFVTEQVVESAKDVGFNVERLDTRDSDMLLKLYHQFERLYSFCRPGDHRNSLWANAMTTPSQVDVKCVDDSGSEVGAWGEASCLGGTWDSARLESLSTCHAQLRTHALYDDVREESTRAAWLFCACSAAIPQWLDSKAYTAAKVSGALATAFLVLLEMLSCVLCCAFKPKKQKKKKDKSGKHSRKSDGKADATSLLGGGSTELGGIPKVNHVERHVPTAAERDGRSGLEHTVL